MVLGITFGSSTLLFFWVGEATVDFKSPCSFLPKTCWSSGAPCSTFWSALSQTGWWLRVPSKRNSLVLWRWHFLNESPCVLLFGTHSQPSSSLMEVCQVKSLRGGYVSGYICSVHYIFESLKSPSDDNVLFLHTSFLLPFSHLLLAFCTKDPSKS